MRMLRWINDQTSKNKLMNGYIKKKVGEISTKDHVIVNKLELLELSINGRKYTY